MGSQIPSGSDRTRTNWTTAMESYFIDLLLDQVHRGNRMGHTFNKQAWNEMLTMFNANFGSPYDVNVLKSRYTVMWTQFNDIKNILDQNGFYWDRTRQMVMASNNVWDTYMKAHPDAQSYRNKALRNFNDLCLIYAHTSADGRYSMSSHDVDFDDDIQGVTTVVGVPVTNLAPVSREHSKTDWTLAMDRYFVKLMLDHLKKGNKIGSTFNRQAWKDMVSLFNRKFGSNYGKSFLKQHYKKLLNYYSDIKKLLEVKGFSWDEKQQMIVADRDIWDKHIKVHPDAHLYRKKHLLNYQDLGLIYGNTIINGHCDHLLQGNNFEEDILQFKTGEGRECHFLDDNECLRGYWSLQMDCYFTDLLLDQALRGNKIGFKFTTQAWIEMVTLFTAKFGSHYMKDALNNRYKYLRRQYNDIKVLLKQHGFYWDEKQEMVTARDDIWDSYIKVHPDALLYRNKLIPGYHKLCVIYDQETSDGRCSHSASSADLNSDFPDLLIGEDIQDHAIGESQRTDWTPSMDRYLIDLMLEEVHSGNKVEYAINNQAWIDMVMMFNERFAVQLDKDILRSCSTSLEMLYYDMKNILDQKGFSWDEKQQLIAAHDDVWKAYFKEHPDATSYRTRPKPNYNDLCLIYGNSDSNLGCKLAGQDIHCNGDGTEHNDCHRRNDWTPPMDRYFIDLMLEKVRNGSMIDHKFEKLAWGDMVAKFSAEFGCQHDKDVLKSRYILLRKRFIDMKTLLGQGGFAWDETRQMIIADDDLWDDYVKEHPDAWTYQNRTLPNFNDLFLIYGDANSSRNGNYFSHSRDTGDNDLEMNIGDEKYDQSPGSCGRRIPWTKEMDSYLIDLMLEQLQRVTELGCTFNKQAWTWINASFSEEFGLVCEKDVLEDRYHSLMKVYKDVTDILNQNGVSWDETVRANDVWEAYFKEHPDAISYQGTILENYSNLCLISAHLNRKRSNRLRIKLETSNNALGMKGDDKSENLQSPARRKRKPKSLSTSIYSIKSQRTFKNERQETFEKKPDTVKTMFSNEDGKYYNSIETIVAALQTVSDMDDELFLEACELLEDERKAKMFVAMDVTARRKWLLKKLNR